MTQLGLFQEDAQYDKPLPLMVAEKWNFNLTHVDPTGDAADYLYCAIEWYVGLGGDRARWSKSKNDWLTASQPVVIEVKRQRRQAEMLEFVTAKGLYDIAQHMESKSGRDALDGIKDFLSKSGVVLDNARRDAGKAAELTQALSIHHQRRMEGMVTRNELTSWLRDNFGNSFAFGKFTNEEYKGLFGRTAAQIKAQSGKKNARDAMTTEGIGFVYIAETACLRLFNGRDAVTVNEAFTIVRDVCEPLGANVELLQNKLGIDLATGKSLLAGGH